MRKKTVDSKLLILAFVGVLCVIVMLIVFTTQNTKTHNNKVTESTTQKNKDLEDLGISKELSSVEEENIEAIKDSMSYLAVKYGSRNYTYDNYERVDDLTEYIYVLDNEGTKYIVMRQKINNEYIYREVESDE